jgi:phage gp36-like protein
VSYATQDELVDRYGNERLVQLTDRAEPPAGAIDAAVMTRALDDTDALIDGYLAARYALPLPTVPSLLRDLAATIGLYKLHVDVVPEKVREDYRDAIKTLQAIAAGQVRLDIGGTEPPAAQASGGVRFTGGDRVFTAGNLKAGM